MALFESYERRIAQINAELNKHGISSIEEAKEICDKAGVDAIITSSLHIVRTALKIAPRMECHISTQMSIANSYTIEYYKQEGVKRVVLAREVSLDELNKIMPSDMPIEVFIHGALCISYSGQCLMSSLIGGRSGNRGACAGSCRLKYDVVDANGKFTFMSLEL